MNIERLKHRLERLKKQQKELELKHRGREHEYTYYGGYALGYVDGKIHVLEDIVDNFQETE